MLILPQNLESDMPLDLSLRGLILRNFSAFRQCQDCLLRGFSWCTYLMQKSKISDNFLWSCQHNVFLLRRKGRRRTLGSLCLGAVSVDVQQLVTISRFTHISMLGWVRNDAKKCLILSQNTALKWVF